MDRNLVLHIGHAKTGTTAVQRTLVASRAALSDQRVLYPETGPHKHNHKTLIPYLVASGKTQASSPELGAASDLWQTIARQIDEENPHTVVLSSEQLFRPWTPMEMSEMIAKLRALAATVSVIAYVREPAATTLSALQQKLKSQALPGGGLLPPNPRLPLQAYKSAGFDAMKVRVFDRDKLAGGDVVQDFFETALADIDFSRVEPVSDPNTSMSAEAMALLHEIHGGKRRFRVGKPRREVSRADRELAGFSRPRLRPEVRNAIHSSFEHFDWLRDEFGVEFSNIEAPETDRASARALLASIATVEDLCPVDATRKSRLWRSLATPDAMIRRLFRPA